MNFTFELQRVAIPNEPWKRHYFRPLSGVDTGVFHRIHVGDPKTDDANSIAAYFHARKKAMPYPIVIPRDQPKGSRIIVQQTMPLTRKSPHAAAWNTRSVGLGVVGDFRTQKPTDKQKAACHWVALRLLDVLSYELAKRVPPKDYLVTLHSNLTTGTSDPEKLTGGKEECPGPLFAPTWRAIRAALRSAGRLI